MRSLSYTAADKADRNPVDFCGSSRFNSSAEWESSRSSGSLAGDTSRAGVRRQVTHDLCLPLPDLGTRFLSPSSDLNLPSLDQFDDVLRG